jgi:hypothetical protein
MWVDICQALPSILHILPHLNLSVLQVGYFDIHFMDMKTGTVEVKWILQVHKARSSYG